MKFTDMMIANANTSAATAHKVKFTDIAGQAHAKRALEVALAGEHTIRFIGSHESQKDVFNELGKQIAIELSLEQYRSGAFAPCPCGYYGSKTRECTCSNEAITEWQLNHQTNTDITVNITIRLHFVQPDTVIKWAKNGYKDGEPHGSVMARIKGARVILENNRKIDSGVWSLLRAAIVQLRLTPRQVKATLDVANTVAALRASDIIKTSHLAEAIQYREEQ